MTRVEPDGILRVTGQYGQSQVDPDESRIRKFQIELLKQSITMGRVQQASTQAVEWPEHEHDFFAIPFSPASEVQGALSISFRNRAKAMEIRCLA
jgi:hypothetical protein